MSLVSIHAPARGATRPSPHMPALVGRFNPRARAGRDQAIRDGKVSIEVSIHAPARGATGCACDLDERSDVSIHAPARGATADQQQRGGDPPVSIHAPARGATSYCTVINC